MDIQAHKWTQIFAFVLQKSILQKKSRAINWKGVAMFGATDSKDELLVFADLS